jgi:poly-gamma-glutamate capsule biosynthesis protein CapA/YwtB (metallophosphatase superfamily)
MNFLLCVLTACLTAALCFACFLLVTAMLPGPPEEPVLLSGTLRPRPTATPTPAPTATTSPTPEPTATPSPTPVPDVTIRIRVAGDVMCHDRQLRASEGADGRYEMGGWFAAIQPSLEEADLAIGNLETVFAGEEKGYSGFPRFNTPDEMAEALKGAGFDVMTLANNHIYDFRAAGIARTIGVLDAAGLAHTGAYAERGDFDEMLIVDVKGVRVGILAYTDVFNSKPDEDFRVRALSRERAEKDIGEMRRQGADVVLVMAHWGEEYEETPGSRQKEQARMLAQSGADFIFGSHSHVVQTAEMLEMEGADGRIRRVPVAYSMGNFISNQQNRPCDMGIIFEIELEKKGESGETALKRAGFVPTVVWRGYESGRDTYQVLPCGVYKEMTGHPKRHRCQTVWEHEVGLMGEGFEAMEN